MSFLERIIHAAHSSISVAKWLPQLEKKLEQCAETGHESFRMFMSAEPSADPAFHCIPQGILESAVKM